MEYKFIDWIKMYSESPHFVLYFVLRTHFPHTYLIQAFQATKKEKVPRLQASLNVTLFLPCYL